MLKYNDTKTVLCPSLGKKPESQEDVFQMGHKYQEKSVCFLAAAPPGGSQGKTGFVPHVDTSVHDCNISILF